MYCTPKNCQVDSNVPVRCSISSIRSFRVFMILDYGVDETKWFGVRTITQLILGITCIALSVSPRWIRDKLHSCHRHWRRSRSQCIRIVSVIIRRCCGLRDVWFSKQAKLSDVWLYTQSVFWRSSSVCIWVKPNFQRHTTRRNPSTGSVFPFAEKLRTFPVAIPQHKSLRVPLESFI